MKTVLIVDDNTTLACFTASSIREDLVGVEAVTAATCKEARTEAAHFSPAVMITDMKLPDGDGLQLLREFSVRFPQMTAIVTSGNELPKTIQAQFFGFLRKPYGPELLISLVRKALNAASPGEVEDSTEQASQHSPGPCFGYDRHHVLNRFAGLLAGLRALQADMRVEAHDPVAVRKLAGEHVDRLFGIAVELADIIKQSDTIRRGGHE